MHISIPFLSTASLHNALLRLSLLLCSCISLLLFIRFLFYLQIVRVPGDGQQGVGRSFHVERGTYTYLLWR